MGGRRNIGKGAWRGGMAGAACGALATALYYLYHEATNPNPYNVILVGHAPVFMTFGGMAGLLVWAMRDSATDRVEHQEQTLTGRGKRKSLWRGPAIGAASGALVPLLYWVHMELTSPSAYGRFVVLTFGSVLTIFCAVAGLVFGETRDID